MNGHSNGIDYANQQHIDRERQEAIELQEFYGREQKTQSVAQNTGKEMARDDSAMRDVRKRIVPNSGSLEKAA